MALALVVNANERRGLTTAAGLDTPQARGPGDSVGDLHVPAVGTELTEQRAQITLLLFVDPYRNQIEQQANVGDHKGSVLGALGHLAVLFVF